MFELTPIVKQCLALILQPVSRKSLFHLCFQMANHFPKFRKRLMPCGSYRMASILPNLMVGMTRLERATSRSRTVRSTKLSYIPAPSV